MKYTLSKGLTNSPDARVIRQSVFVEEQGFEYEFTTLTKPLCTLFCTMKTIIHVQRDDCFSTVA